VRSSSPAGHCGAGTIRDDIKRLDLALDLVDAANYLWVAGEPPVPPFSLLVKTTKAAVDVDLGLVEVPALGLDEVIKRLGGGGVSHAPPSQLSFLFPALASGEAPAGEAAVQSGDVRRCLLMFEDRSIERVIGVGASTSREVGPPATQTVQLALGSPDGGGGISGDTGQEGMVLGHELAPA
jgi:hypothetical protein